MKSNLRRHFHGELQAYEEALRENILENAWAALERAHVLSQAHAWPHVRVHFLMAKLALKRRDYRELFGQMPRLLLAAPGSLFGLAPKGNTGGSNVGIFTPMPIQPEIESKLSE